MSENPDCLFKSLKETMEYFDLKVESLMELKFNPGFRVIGKYLSQIDCQYRVNLTQIFSNYSESRVEFKFRQWFSFSSQNDSIFFFPLIISRKDIIRLFWETCEWFVIGVFIGQFIFLFVMVRVKAEGILNGITKGTSSLSLFLVAGFLPGCRIESCGTAMWTSFAGYDDVRKV